MRIWSRSLSLLMLAAVLAACGFTLRGTTPLPKVPGARLSRAMADRVGRVP